MVGNEGGCLRGLLVKTMVLTEQCAVCVGKCMQLRTGDGTLQSGCLHVVGRLGVQRSMLDASADGISLAVGCCTCGKEVHRGKRLLRGSNLLRA